MSQTVSTPLAKGATSKEFQEWSNKAKILYREVKVDRDLLSPKPFLDGIIDELDNKNGNPNVLSMSKGSSEAAIRIYARKQDLAWYTAQEKELMATLDFSRMRANYAAADN